tara:strand:+ start:590 stop:913 length:324 start_codon:yes stop_codon:yes gene_type:complete
MKQHNYFSILKNSDTTEGRGPMHQTGIGFTSEADALAFVKSEIYAKKFGVQGMPGSDYCVDEVTLFVYKNLDEYMAMAPDVEKERKRRVALKKLSTEERELLGLGDK